MHLSVQHAEKGFNNVMKVFQDRIFEYCRNELQLECQKKQSIDNIEAGVNSVVEKYRAEFLDKTKGNLKLFLYIHKYVCR